MLPSSACAMRAAVVRVPCVPAVGLVVASGRGGAASSAWGVRHATTHARSDPVQVLADHFSPAVPRSPKGNNIVVERSKGSWIYAVDGRKYLDLQTGIGVANTGHSHPKVVKAVQDQVAKGIHWQQNCVISPPVVELIEKMQPLMPPGINRFFFNCTGTEANESAVKLARHETGKQNIIVFKGGFHGRSLAALAMTSSKTAYGVGYGPLPGGFHQTPFPTCATCKCAPSRPGPPAFSSSPACCGTALDSLKALLKETTAPSDTAAILIEPILGEGGYLPPPPGFFKELRQICDDNGMLLISDEVQSGVGRTGKMWAIEHEQVQPDIIVFAKGIASGLPLSGIATRGDFMKKSPPSSMGGTFGANAVSAAAACATLDVVVEERLLDNATARGAQLQAGLRALSAKFPEHVLEVRGRGCMVGWEFNHAGGSGFAGHVTAACMQEGLLLLTAGWREIIRFIPPLTISESEMDTALAMLEQGFTKAVATWKGPAPGYARPV